MHLSDDERKLRQMAEDTAAELTGWRVERKDRDYGHYVKIEGPDSAALGFHLNAHKKVVSISGEFPADRHGKAYHLNYNIETPRINVSLSKTGAQVAKDIERRLWPDYEPLLVEALARHASHEEHENQSLGLAKRLAKIVGAKVDERSPSNLRLDLYHSELLPEFNGTLEVTGDSVRLDRFYLNAEQAEAVLRALAKTR